MRLDVTTPRGRQSQRDEAEMLTVLQQRWGARYAHTPADSPARVDGAFLRGATMVAVTENKVRNDSRADLERWGGTYLITASKLDDGAAAAALFGVPFLVCVYLKPDRQVLWWKVAKPTGAFVFDFTRATTRTQATCNGGIALRQNAFLPLAHAHTISMTTTQAAAA